MRKSSLTPPLTILAPCLFPSPRHRPSLTLDAMPVGGKQSSEQNNQDLLPKNDLINNLSSLSSLCGCFFFFFFFFFHLLGALNHHTFLFQCCRPPCFLFGFLFRVCAGIRRMLPVLHRLTSNAPDAPHPISCLGDSRPALSLTIGPRCYHYR
jgi:hypothetical protein